MSRLYYTIHSGEGYIYRHTSGCREELITYLSKRRCTLLDVSTDTFHPHYIEEANKIIEPLCAGGTLTEDMSLLVEGDLITKYLVVLHAYLGHVRDRGGASKALLETVTTLHLQLGGRVELIHKNTYTGCQTWLYHIHPKYWAHLLMDNLTTSKKYMEYCDYSYINQIIVSAMLHHLGFGEAVNNALYKTYKKTKFEGSFSTGNFYKVSGLDMLYTVMLSDGSTSPYVIASINEPVPGRVCFIPDGYLDKLEYAVG